MRHQVGVGGDLRLTPAPELPPDPTPEGEREWEDCTGAQPPQVGHSCRDERGQRDGAQLSTFSSVQSHSRVRLFMTPWTAARQASLSITNSRSLLKLMSIDLVVTSNPLISVIPFSFFLQSFPASGSFPMSQLFTSGDQNIEVLASASVQFSSVAQSCPTLPDPMDCSTPGFPVYYQLPELAQTHVH